MRPSGVCATNSMRKFYPTRCCERTAQGVAETNAHSARTVNVRESKPSSAVEPSACSSLFRFPPRTRLCERMRKTDQRGQRCVNDVCGHARENLGVPSLVFEPIAEMRADEQAAHLRDDAAANVQATEGAERQNEVAGQCAEQRAKHADRLHANATRSLHRPTRHVGWCERLGHNPLDRTERIVQIDEPCSRQ